MPLACPPALHAAPLPALRLPAARRHRGGARQDVLQPGAVHLCALALPHCGGLQEGGGGAWGAARGAAARGAGHLRGRQEELSGWLPPPVPALVAPCTEAGCLYPRAAHAVLLLHRTESLVLNFIGPVSETPNAFIPLTASVSFLLFPSERKSLPACLPLRHFQAPPPALVQQLHPCVCACAVRYHFHSSPSCYTAPASVLGAVQACCHIKLLAGAGCIVVSLLQALVNLVTALVPSDTACLASSPGSTRRTAVWISREVRVGFLFTRDSCSRGQAGRAGSG